MLSLPLWECGLKLRLSLIVAVASTVTPFMGVWIEIFSLQVLGVLYLVTPFMGVWIEICL